jgi:hypothetical protein
MGLLTAEAPFALRNFSLNENTQDQLKLIHGSVLTYSLKDQGEICTHGLSLLASSTFVLIVGSDLTGLFYPRKSLTNSIEYFAMAVLEQFPWIKTVHWEVAEMDARGNLQGVSFAQCVTKDGRIILADPTWEEIRDARHIREEIELGVPADIRLV